MLRIGTVASVDGVRADDGSGGEVLLASLVILDTSTAATVERIMGTVNSANADTHTLEVATSAGDMSVRLEADGLILLLGDFEGGTRSESGNFTDLTEGHQVEIYGRGDAVGYFVAQVVLVID